MKIIIPITYRESLVFERLVELLGKDDLQAADHIYLSVFRALARLAADGKPTGRFTKAEIPIIERALSDVRLVGNTHSLSPTRILESLVDPVKLFERDGDSYFCPAFLTENGRAAQTAESMQSVGGRVGKFYQRMKKEEESALQLSLLIPKENLVDEEEKPLDMQSTDRVTRTIRNIDMALGHPTREQWQYNKDVIQQASRVIKKYKDNQIKDICTCIVKSRNHSALDGATTETLLPKFDQILPMLAARK